MSSSAQPVIGAPRRVRHLARDAVAVMAFSAATSCGMALSLLVLSALAH